MLGIIAGHSPLGFILDFCSILGFLSLPRRLGCLGTEDSEEKVLADGVSL
jgi:hypothetical protein